jgi:hypothetical protein
MTSSKFWRAFSTLPCATLNKVHPTKWVEQKPNLSFEVVCLVFITILPEENVQVRHVLHGDRILTCLRAVIVCAKFYRKMGYCHIPNAGIVEFFAHDALTYSRLMICIVAC